ncbi:MAG: UDP-N-acetylmuramoyl-tripeptide--D-alanyl-D-alanine ligase [Deltaproteobacteria bacterium]|nr:UDP-N-acetylmuramoyl-tripeptide--D-alanyl-D-alanine ligase [Deltaproteobacteria bacterium]
MSRLSAEFIARATGGELVGGDFTVDRVEKDSRQDLRGALYVALRGERFDGHDFVCAAFERGAVAALVDATHAPALPAAGPLVVVADTERALLDLAAAHLERMPARRVALTGSNGKTTTKEMIAAICRAAHGDDAVHATTGNLNNTIGMPLTALGIEPRTRVAVLEMGMNHPGEIAAMARCARPHVGLIVNVQRAHLEGLGSLEGVAAAKGELFEALTADAVAVVNLDDSHCTAQARRTAARRVTFGSTGDADVALLQRVPVAGQQRLVLRVGGQEVAAVMPHEGAHNAHNATAAAAVGHALGIDTAAIAAGLAAAPLVHGRLSVRQLGDVQVIDDTYNANPSSMQAAIEVAVQHAIGRRLLVVLGEMRELGSQSAQLHRELGAVVARTRPARAWFSGAFAADCRSGAIDGGLPGDRVAIANDAAEFADDVARAVTAGDVVLIKGSRGARMERVVERLAAALGS